MKKAEYNDTDKSCQYGVFKKKGWKPVMLFHSKEKALESIKGKEHFYEVRKVEWLWTYQRLQKIMSAYI